MNGALVLYGHPFSSYTWKVLIALYAEGIAFEFRIFDGDHPEYIDFVREASPLGTFPVLADGDNILFESTSIIEYLARHHGAESLLVPLDPDAAIGSRMLDRVFDNYVMGPMQAIVQEHLLKPEDPDMSRIEKARDKLQNSYRWLESWLHYYPLSNQVTLIECTAAPALFYADWVHPIGEDFPRLKRWRAHLLQLAPVARCVDEARPFRTNFPPGAPDRD